MPRLKLLIPEHPADDEPIDTIPVYLAGVDMSLSLAALIVESLALEAAEFTVAIGGAAIGNFLNLGSGYLAARNEIAWRNLAEGYSLGVVMGADGVGARRAASYFGHRSFQRNAFVPGAAGVARDAYVEGLIRGYCEGRELTPGQKRDVAMDLRHRAQKLPGWSDWAGETSQSAKGWSEETWKDYYRFMAAVFRQYHMKA